MLARALSRSLARSVRPAAVLRGPARPARAPLPGLSPLLHQSRAFAIKKRQPYQGGDPGAYSDPLPAAPSDPPPSEPPVEAWQTSSTAPSTPSDAPSDLFLRKATPATGGGSKGGDGLPKSAYVSSTDRKRERLARLMFAAFIAAAIGGGIYLGRDLSEFEQTIYDTAAVPNGWSFPAMYARIKARVQNVLDFYNEPPFEKLLPDPHPDYSRPYTLVIALEDLCVHSTWDREHGWRIAKRPGLDYFLAYMFQYYEIVVFTNQHDQIAAPIIQKMDQYPGYIMYPLFRSHTRYKDGKYIKVPPPPSPLPPPPQHN